MVDCEINNTKNSEALTSSMLTSTRHIYQDNKLVNDLPQRNLNCWFKLSRKFQSNKIYVGNDIDNGNNTLNIDIRSSKLRSSESGHFSISKTIVNPLFFKDPVLRHEYATYKKQRFNILFQVPNLIVTFTIIATHFNFQLIGLDTSAAYLYTVGLILCIIAVILCFVYIWVQTVLTRKWYSDINDVNEMIKQKCKYVVHTFCWGRIEDILLITSITSAAFVLIGRVLVGQCPPDNVVHSIWSAQACNPFAASGGIPIDTVILLYALPSVCQMLFTGVTMSALIIGWIIILGAVIFSVVYVNSPMLLYVALASILFITMTFELECRTKVSFLQARYIDETARQKDYISGSILSKDHELELSAPSNENENKLVEVETFHLRSLMGNVAHDLKTPLQAITAELEILKSELKLEGFNVDPGSSSSNLESPSSSKYDSTISSIFSSLEGTCKFMTMAINRSQDYMKTSSNIALVPHNETLDLMETINTAVRYITCVQSGRILLVAPLPPGICNFVVSDKQWLCENLMCFVSNAAKYSDKGAKVNISVALDSESDVQPMLHFMVEDTGVGIDQNVRPLLFQPFNQAQRMAGGTGLGLYSLAKRVEALGGSYGVDGRRDGSQGSMFWFKIPYRPDETMSAEYAIRSSGSGKALFRRLSTQEFLTRSGAYAPLKVAHFARRDFAKNRRYQSKDSSSVAKGGLSFLVVDDTGSILKLLDRVLQQNGHAVKTAENGSQSLEILKKSYETGNYFDVVVTDLQMPVLDGFESIKRFREFENAFSSSDSTPKRHQLVIGMSANSDAQSRQDALNVGMDYFVTKPFKYEDLKTLIPKQSKQNNSKILIEEL